MALKKLDLVGLLQVKLGYSKKESSDLLETTISIIKNTLESGENVKIPGFGIFSVKQKSVRRGRNPHTGESLTISARRILSFKASDLLKKAINNGEK